MDAFIIVLLFIAINVWAWILIKKDKI